MDDIRWFEMAQAVGSVATAAGVIVATIGVFLTRRQIVFAREQSATQFEDDMVREYREIARTLPVAALLGEELEEEEYRDALSAFYRYIDLSKRTGFSPTARPSYRRSLGELARRNRVQPSSPCLRKGVEGNQAQGTRYLLGTTAAGEG